MSQVVQGQLLAMWNFMYKKESVVKKEGNCQIKGQKD